MIPRTVRMAAAVDSQFTSQQYLDYGNIILNGYLTVEPNTTNKKAWQYAETTTAPVNLPSVSSVRPVLRGWTTNYMSYFTREQSGYSAYPGQENPFLFDIWNYYQNPGPASPTGPLLTVSGGLGGNDMVPGGYQISVTGISGGEGAVLYVVVNLLIPGDPFSGGVVSITVTSGGTGYIAGDLLNNIYIPTVSGMSGPPIKLNVISTAPATTIPAAGYSQCPRRFYQNQVADFVPPTANRRTIGYSFLYPVQTKQTPPPIDYVAP